MSYAGFASIPPETPAAKRSRSVLVGLGKWRLSRPRRVGSRGAKALFSKIPILPCEAAAYDFEPYLPRCAVRKEKGCCAYRLRAVIASCIRPIVTSRHTSR